MDVKVAFTAIVAQKDLTVRQGETVIFDTAITNTEQGYDEQSGIFTAPLAGTYIFYTDIQIYWLIQDMVRDGHVLIRNHGFATNADHYVRGSRIISIQLAAGDKVWIRAGEGDEVIHGYGETSFSGWLINSFH